jgi:uncharacterized protein YidB (DUF937 family)
MQVLTLYEQTFGTKNELKELSMKLGLSNAEISMLLPQGHAIKDEQLARAILKIVDFN